MATRITTHPGEMLREEFLEPWGLSASALARAIGVPPNRITDLCRERRDMTADTALRLAQYTGMSADFWLGLQLDHDLSKARAERDYSHIKPHEGSVSA
ncbi:MAG: HigA family addiction module antitoxin [Pseudomonadota bacterium]